MINEDYLKRDISVTIRISESTNSRLDYIKKVYDLGTTDAILKAVHNQYLEARPIILREKPKEKVEENGAVKNISISVRLNECDMDEVEYVESSYGLSRTGAIRYSIEREAYRIIERNREDAMKNGWKWERQYKGWSY